MFLRLWLFVLSVLAVGVVMFAAADDDPVRRTMTDLPPGIVRGEVDRMDILADAAPVGEIIPRICRGFKADCVIVIQQGGPSLAWTCSGEPEYCWRTFLAALSQLGVSVRILPGTGGAAYSFSFSGNTSPAAPVAPEASAAPRRR